MTDQAGHRTILKLVPPESSCHGGLTLTSKQLTDLFALIDDARRECPSIFRSAAEMPISATDESVGSTCVADNLSSGHHSQLTRSCTTAEHAILANDSVINVESMSAMKLRSEIVSLRESAGHITLEMKRLQSELDAVRRDRELLKTRDTTYQTTIKMLEQKLEEACPNNDSTQSHDSSQGELEQLKVENELFASQIIENEVEMREIRTILGFMDKENELMRSTLDELECKYAKEKVDETTALVAQIETLQSRISEMEQNRELDRQCFQSAAHLQQKNSLMPKPKANDGMTSELCNDAFEEAIEVNIQGPDDTKPKVDDTQGGSICCICFPFQSDD
jgi:chromosome segregation ATPase